MLAASVTPDPLVTELRTADRCIARALDILCATPRADASGLPVSMRLMLESGWTRSDVRVLVRAADVLAGLPLTRAAFRAGALSWGQVRALVASLSRLDAPTRSELDAFIARGASSDPDDLLRAVDDEVERLRDDLVLRRERRALGRGFLAVQGRLDGTGTFYGEADAESFATLVSALDAAAPLRPEASRAQLRFDALLHMVTGGRPARVVIYANVDARGSSAQLMWPVPGRAARLSSRSSEALACDSTVIPVVFDGADAVAGAARPTVSRTARNAVVARDGGCRFPGCSAPAAWSDVHHVVHRARGGSNEVRNLVLLCRRCHRRVHLYRWRISMHDDGTTSFTHRGKTFTSAPRARPLTRE